METATPSTKTSVQSHPRSTGLGSLEASRGDSHLADPDNGAVLSGEQDISGAPWDARRWSTASAGGVAWTGGTGTPGAGRARAGAAQLVVGGLVGQQLDRYGLVGASVERRHVVRAALVRGRLVGSALVVGQLDGSPVVGGLRHPRHVVTPV